MPGSHDECFGVLPTGVRGGSRPAASRGEMGTRGHSGPGPERLVAHDVGWGRREDKGSTVPREARSAL